MAYSGFDLSGRAAVVIGGTSGIGHAIARALAEAGADVAPTSRRAEVVVRAAQEIQDLGRRSVALTSDVADQASLENLLHECVDAFGKVDILVNCAGKTRRTSSIEDVRLVLPAQLTRMSTLPNASTHSCSRFSKDA